MQKQQRNIVREAIALFQQLQQRRGELHAELEEIDRALSQMRGAAPITARATPATVRRRGRGQNSMPLREAVAQVLSGGAKTRHEVLAGVQKVGYRFASANPMNSLQTFLYGSGKKLLTRRNGKFGLAGGASAAAGKNGWAKPAKAKRTMSAAARKKIAAAQKARWAKLKAAKK